jgi:DNA-binding MarR family transcriptional regulator
VSPRPAAARERPAADVRRLLSEVRRASDRLARVARQLQDEDSLAAGERAMLMELAERGPQTVSDMARARPVSRHTVQVLVNGLLRRSLARLGEHPRSQRAKLVLLTPSGKALVRRLLDREALVLTSLAQQLTGADVKLAVEALARLSLALEGQDVERQASSGSLAIVGADLRESHHGPDG